MSTIKNLLIRIGISDTQVSAGVNRINRALESVAKRVDHLEKIGRVGQFAALAGSAIQLGRAFAPVVTTLGQFAAAAAPAWGAILALPAVLAVAAGAIGVFKVGMVGMGDAMKAVASGDAKQLDAAMKKLPPNARALVLTMGRVEKSFEPIRRAVQQRLFAGLDKDIAQTARRNLPALGFGMNAVAVSLNGLGRTAVRATNTPLFSGMLARVLTTTAVVLRAFQPAVKPLITALARLVVIGLPLAKSFGLWAARGAKTAATFLASARAAAAMHRIVTRAAAVFKKGGNAAGAMDGAMVELRIAWDNLSKIGKNVWSVVTAVGRAMSNSKAPSKSLLDLITQLSDRMAKWANSAQGQKQLSQLFSSLQQVASNLMEILPQLGGVLTLILTVINGMPGPVRNVVLQMLAWSIVLNKFSGPIGGAIKLIGGLGKVMKTVNAGGVVVGKGFAALGKGVGLLGAATGRTAGKLGIAAGNAARTLGSVALNMGKAAGSALLSLGRLAVASAATVARVVAGWVVMGVQSLIQAARMAAAWFIALGPIGWITAAVIAIVALIILNWGTIWKYTKKVWGWISGAVSSAVSWVVDFVSKHWRLLVSIIGGPMGLAVALVTKYWKQIIGFISGIPGTIGRFFSGAGKWLYGAGRAILVGLWNGLVSVSGWLARSLWNLIKSIIPDVIQRVLGISSPSKVTHRLGAFTGQGLALGVLSSVTAVRRAANVLASAAIPATPGRAGTARILTPRAVAASLAGQASSLAGSGGMPTVRIVWDWGKGNGELKRVVQKMVRVTGGGNVATALGGNH